MLWCALVLAASGAASENGLQSWAEGAFEGAEARVAARLLVHPDDVDSDVAVRVGVLLEMDPGWHVYWRNPGDVGLPTRLRWSVDGAQVVPTAWPAPSVFHESDSDLVSYGYSEEVLLASLAEIGAPAPDGRQVRADVDLLACRSECIPASLALSLVLGTEPDQDAADVRAHFENAATRTPRDPESLGIELESRYSRSAIRPGDAFEAAIAIRSCPPGSAPDCRPFAPAGGANAFIPDRLTGLTLHTIGARDLDGDPHLRALALTGRAETDGPVETQRLQGVLAVQRTGEAVRHLAVDLALPRAPRDSQTSPVSIPWTEVEPPSASRFLHAFLLALLGGLILNLMPCVLPVLAIKVFAVAQIAGEGRRAVISHALAYTAGILVTMGVLALAVIALRAAGTAVGWGFQFQEPLFVAGVSAVVVLFAANLFGVFEIHPDTNRLAALGAGATGARRSFFEGLLAVVLATPCSAPFLGTAVGFAFASSAPVVLALFLAIGGGLALPYLIIAAFPASARLLPRPGPWMLKLRAGLGFALLATAVWLLWVVGRSHGADAMALLLGLLVTIAFASWVLGALQSASRLRAGLAPCLALVALVPLAWGAVSVTPEQGKEIPSVVKQEARPYVRSEVEALVASGQPALVYFTADWCLTCKLNESRVLSHPEVRAELDLLGIAVFEADWTQRDSEIRDELARHGRAGVPLYLVYPAGRPDAPVLLPELLTRDRLLHALRDARRPTRKAAPAQRGEAERRSAARRAVTRLTRSIPRTLDEGAVTASPRRT